MNSSPNHHTMLTLSDVHYDLPADRIADRPLADRSGSRLLVADVATATLTHQRTSDLPSVLPPSSMLVVNRSRVIPARLVMRKPSGGLAEVLLASPLLPSSDPVIVLQTREGARWTCLIGGRNITVGTVLSETTTGLSARVVEREGVHAVVDLVWPGDTTLGSLLEAIGHIPLPPYMRRDDDLADRERYQTVYARDDGSVAAPTAGLHLTDALLERMADAGIRRTDVVLHVGLGTFRPITVTDARDHVMHAEQIVVERSTVQALLDHCRTERPWITSVGTTSMRTLESMAILGRRLCAGHTMSDVPQVEQWEAFGADATRYSREERLAALLAWMDAGGHDRLVATTALMLAPGAYIAMVDALLTNFHQPESTLLFLVAALCGGPWWRTVYDEALANDYRFLSYGDACLFLAPRATADVSRST